jgi:prepilin signal peptidase PulO-like enzyme (type II secretory pathway)
MTSRAAPQRPESRPAGLSAGRGPLAGVGVGRHPIPYPIEYLVTLLLLRVGVALLGGAGAAWALVREVVDARGPRIRRAAIHCAAGTGLALLLLPALREYPGGEWTQAVLLTCLLYVLAVVDLHTLHVPLPLVFGGIVFRVAYLALLERTALLPMMLGLFAGAGMLYLAALAYETVRGRPGLGQGDAAVLGLIGCFVGWQGLVPVLLGAALAGLIGGGGTLLVMRKPFDTPLPFAPFLAAGGWAVYGAQRAGWLPGAPF